MEISKFDELIFVVLQHEEGVKAAVEGNLGLAVFGNSIADLTEKILFEVQNYFKDGFDGSIRIREFN